jgi:hypothetical protein
MLKLHQQTTFTDQMIMKTYLRPISFSKDEKEHYK